MAHESFRLEMPDAWSSGVIFASPHSGAQYPAELLERTVLSKAAIRSSEDAFVDLLFAKAPKLGAPLLAAEAPRAYVDLNRAPDELDPALIGDVATSASNPRISSGLGVIPRVVANGRPIYRGKISRAEAERRLDQVWHPYHDCLTELIAGCRTRFGEAILIDCHSMPHEAIDAIAQGGKRSDIVLGDRFGASADAIVVDVIEAAFTASGLRVARNAPFAGAYTAQAYGRPSRRQHVVQVEIDRSLYMDERRILPRPDFAVMQAAVTHMIAEITAYGRGRTALAAE